MIAGIGTRHYSGYADVAALAPKFTLITEPTKSAAAAYHRLYPEFVRLYPQLRTSFKNLGNLRQK